MKKIFLMMTAISILALTACIKEEEDTSVDMSQLVGSWREDFCNPSLIPDPQGLLTFDSDGVYRLTAYSPTQEVIFEGTYKISSDDNTVELLSGYYKEVYFIAKLNSREMTWRDPHSSRFPTDRIFVRVTD